MSEITQENCPENYEQQFRVGQINMCSAKPGFSTSFPLKCWSLIFPAAETGMLHVIKYKQYDGPMFIYGRKQQGMFAVHVCLRIKQNVKLHLT